jgi:hypothetical protein
LSDGIHLLLAVGFMLLLGCPGDATVVAFQRSSELWVRLSLVVKVDGIR